MEYYYIVHIWNDDGYSFLVASKEALSRNEVIERCKANRLFYENRDAKDAYVDMNPCNYDIARYGKYTRI